MNVERQPSIPELEERVWQLQDAIVNKLNTNGVRSTGRTGVSVAWHRLGQNIWEMILNRDGEWLIDIQDKKKPTINDLLDTFAELREQGYQDAYQQIERRIDTLSPKEFFTQLANTKKQYVEQNKQRLLVDFIQGMNTALIELEN